MLYQRPTFTCPSAPPHISEMQWDLAVMDPADFVEKHGISTQEATAHLIGAVINDLMVTTSGV